MTPIKRGAVVEYPAIFEFESYPRPYIILSDDSHPFLGEEYVGLAITTTPLDSALQLDEGAWERGGLPRESFVKYWQPTVLKHAEVQNAFGMVRSQEVDRYAGALANLVGVKNPVT